MSRNTVRRYVKAEQKPSYKVRDKKISKVAPFHSYLQERVKAAKPNWIPATVLFREIKKLGYEGGLRILNTYLSTLRPKRSLIPKFISLFYFYFRNRLAWANYH